jgi:tetratricopeptide (TPR) repeat protein
MLRLSLNLALVLLLVFIAAPVYAQRDRDTYNVGPQTFEVSGQVRLAEGNQAAQNVPVRLERFSGGTVDQMFTDSHGRFRFANLQRGYYKVIINAPGFRPAQQDADLQVLFKSFMVFELVADNSKNLLSSPGVLDVIDARAPAEAREEFSRGRAELAKKNTPQAIVHLEKAVSLYPDFFQARLLLGTAFMDVRNWARAEEALARAHDTRPDDPTVLLALGEVNWRQKRYAEAEKLLLDGLKLDDRSWHGHFTLARLYWDKNEIAKAGPPTGRTLQLKPDFAEAHLLAGNILLRLGQQERALVEYQEYLRLDPKGEFADKTRELVQRLSKFIGENKK